MPYKQQVIILKAEKKSTTENIHAVDVRGIISAFGRDWLPSYAEFCGDYCITGKRRKGLTEKRKCKIVTKEGKWGIYQSERERERLKQCLLFEFGRQGKIGFQGTQNEENAIQILTRYHHKIRLKKAVIRETSANLDRLHVLPRCLGMQMMQGS